MSRIQPNPVALNATQTPLAGQTLHVDKTLPTPIYAQLAEQIRLRVHRGVLRPGDALPTVRALAVDLGINANTVARVYRDLQREGLLRLERGLGTFVADGAVPAVSEFEYRRIEELTFELVHTARAAGLRAGELNQLIETVWKGRNQTQNLDPSAPTDTDTDRLPGDAPEERK